MARIIQTNLTKDTQPAATITPVFASKLPKCLVSIINIIKSLMVSSFSAIYLITWVFPILIIIAVAQETQYQNILMGIVSVILWPTSLLGKTQITEQDFGLIFFGWWLIYMVFHQIFKLINIDLHIKRRYVVAIFILLQIISGVLLSINNSDSTYLLTVAVVTVFGLVMLSIKWTIEIIFERFGF